VADDWAEKRREVEALLGHRVNKERWLATLSLRGYIRLGPDIAQAADIAADLEEIAADSGESEPRERIEGFVRSTDDQPTPISRVGALSRVLATDAERIDEVRDWRERELLKGLLERDDCARWILEQHEQPEPGSDFVWLAYAPPGAQRVHRVPVDRAGPLGQLAKIADDLADIYGWQDQQAAMFVLSGAIPIVSPIRVRTVRKGPIFAASRIILEVDPWTDPREVANAYRRTRRDESNNQRYRPLGERALNLAAFVAEHYEETDAERLAAWNRAYPDWKYPDLRSFGRASREATNTLLDPKLFGGNQ
jgi:hypothetical protein